MGKTCKLVIFCAKRFGVRCFSSALIRSLRSYCQLLVGLRARAMLKHRSPKRFAQRLFLAIYLFVQFPIECVQLTSEELKAWNAYEAGAYDQALTIYQEMLATNLPPEKEGVVQYNLGTIYLALHDYMHALTYLQESSTSSQGNPLLNKNSKINLALTRLGQIKELKAIPEFDTDLALSWIQSAYFDLQEAELANCSQEKREGYSVCREDPAIGKIKKELSKIREGFPNRHNELSQFPSLIFLQAALYAWQTKQPALANTFLQFASEDVNTIDKEKRESEKKTPLMMLKKIIYNQRILQHLAVQAYATQEMPDSFFKGLAHSQKLINEEALLFYPAVMESQIIEYHGPQPPEGQPDIRCQCTPWDEVFPIFEEGINAAQKAYQALENQNTQWAINKEEAAASKWEQALLILQHPPQKRESDTQVNAPSAPQSSPVESMQDVLMHLEEMQLDTPPGETPRAQIKEVSKPW